MGRIQEGREHRDDDYVYDFGVEPLAEIPALAQRSLEILLNRGGLPQGPANVSSDNHVFSAAMNNGQIIWLQRAEGGLRGYRPLVVIDEPPRTATATLAALTILEGRRADMERLKTILPLLDPTDQTSMEQGLSEGFSALREQSGKKSGRFISDLMAHRPLNFALALLRYYRPNFDSFPRDKQRGLLEECCQRINEVINSVRSLSDFLEHGEPNQDLRDAVKNPHRDIEAVMLRDVEGLKHREIAEILRVDSPETPRGERDYSTVKKMVDRGRDILHRALGKVGWAKMIESMKAELTDDT
jgi:hypothetical protein